MLIHGTSGGTTFVSNQLMQRPQSVEEVSRLETGRSGEKSTGRVGAPKYIVVDLDLSDDDEDEENRFTTEQKNGVVIMQSSGTSRSLGPSASMEPKTFECDTFQRISS